MSKYTQLDIIADIVRGEVSTEDDEETILIACDITAKDFKELEAKIKTLEADLKKVSEYYFKESTTTAEVLEVEEILEAQI